MALCSISVETTANLQHAVVTRISQLKVKRPARNNARPFNSKVAEVEFVWLVDS